MREKKGSRRCAHSVLAHTLERPAMEYQDRIVARLKRLPHEALVSLVADECAMADYIQRTAESADAKHIPMACEVLVSLVAEACVKSDHVRRAADRAAAQHDPVPQWAVDGVLTSPDLLVPILESLELRHGAAGCVCHAWAQVWQALPLTTRRAVGLKPKNHTWRQEWIDAYVERGRIEGKSWPRAMFEAGGISSVEAMIEYYGAAIRWKVSIGWSLEQAEPYTVISACLAAPLAAAMRERSPRYAACTHSVCDALAAQAKRLDVVVPPVYCNLTGMFGLSTLDPRWELLQQPGASVGISFVIDGLCQADLPDLQVFPDEEGFYVHMDYGEGDVYELQDSDVVCFRGAPPDADGSYHSLIPITSFGSHALPPLATATLESIQQPGEWEVCGQRVRRRLLTVSVTYK